LNDSGDTKLFMFNKFVNDEKQFYIFVRVSIFFSILF
jgi:hypothetical protein